MLKDYTSVYIKNKNSKRVRSEIAYSTNTTIADCRVNDHGNYYFLFNFTVNREHRNKGFGTRILKYILRKAADKPVELTVVKSNEVAMHLYEKLGFKRAFDEYDDEDNEDGIIRMVYKKK
jgi:ribosomal protein S18 acetylase RimI-like enzyme